MNIVSSNYVPKVHTGSGFGTKATAAPRFFNTMENVALGTLPAGFIVKNGTGTPVYASPARGNSAKAMRFFADATAVGPSNTEVWNRSIYDLGRGADCVFISYWLYLDKTGTVCTSTPTNLGIWQWKNTYIGSHPTAYTTGTANETTKGTNAWYQNDVRFFNSGFEVSYYNGLTYSGLNPALPSDGYLFNQWQRINIYVQRSSAPLTPDGQFKIQRIDRASILLNDTTIITHDADDLPWRYIAMGQAIASVNENTVGLGGRVVWKAYFDDVYIDTTQARVEIGDAPTLSSSTHQEIQIPSAWLDTSATVTINQGSITDGTTAYIYVVDSDGNVNTSGYPVTMGSTLTPADNTPPAKPKGLRMKIK